MAKSQSLDKLHLSHNKKISKRRIIWIVSSDEKSGRFYNYNITESQARGSKREFIHHLFISKGSEAELESQLYISMDLGYISSEECQHGILLGEKDGRLVKSLINSIEKSEYFD